MGERRLRVVSLSSQLVRYSWSLQLQEALAAAARQGEAPDTLLVLQVRWPSKSSWGCLGRKVWVTCCTVRDAAALPAVAAAGAAVGDAMEAHTPAWLQPVRAWWWFLYGKLQCNRLTAP